MTITQIEENLKGLVKSVDRERFIYGLLLAYGFPKATITRLESGDRNMSKVEGEVLLQRKMLYHPSLTVDPHLLIDGLKNEPRVSRHDPRFIIVTDFKTLLALDRKTDETLDIALTDLPKHADFLLPWTGAEKKKQTRESEADRKAAEKMARLFDELNAENPSTTDAERHSLNVFLSRLLFCFFAEDTEIFPDKLFTDTLKKVTKDDGSDMHEVLDRLFIVLNTERKQRPADLPGYLNAFEYVNGGLFKDVHHAPRFTAKSRMLALECGDYDWKDINPDIFGSMMQAVVSHDERSGLGMHYTSVPNIMKVIGPLFLDALYEELNDAQEEPRRLKRLLERLGRIRVFDPACGSGNFLIIAYKELRLLEIRIMQRLVAHGESVQMFSRVQLTQFHGIELKDFACEVAMLSLWLAEHQMNVQFRKLFGTANPTLPLREGGHIIQGNATRVDWETVCPKEEGKETYVLGNPPYVGGKGQSKTQKEDMAMVFSGGGNFKELDYIACWFYIAATYIDSNSKAAFVSTSSIGQGIQVTQLWPLIFSKSVEIFFAYEPFPWENNAKGNAGVSCTIIGLSKAISAKRIYNQIGSVPVNHINAYLFEGPNVIINSRLTPLSQLPSILTGNNPYDNGNLTLDVNEADEIITAYPETAHLFKKLTGTNEFLYSIEKRCLWIRNQDRDFAMTIPPIRKRILQNEQFRIKGGDVAKSLAKRSHQFRFLHEAKESLLIIPIVTSERREYVPCGFLSNEYIVNSSAAVVYDCQPYLFAIVSSRMHMIWVRLTGGRLDNRLRYLSGLTYNTYPVPPITDKQKEELEQYVYRIIEERQAHSEKTLAQLYDPDKMPAGLREAHRGLDEAVERCYRSRPFGSDEERLAHLFKLYEEMLEDERAKGTLFAKEKKIPKPRKKRA